MTRIKVIEAIEGAAQLAAHGSTALIGTFTPSTTKAEADARRITVLAALEALEENLKTLADLLCPTDEELKEAGLITSDDSWIGSSVWS